MGLPAARLRWLVAPPWSRGAAAGRSRAVGIWAATSALGFAAGPPIGGFVLAHLPWGAIFLVNVPIVVVCLLAGRLLVPESRDPAGGRLDLGGVMLSTAGLTAIVWAIISGPERGWASAPVLGVGTAGVLLLALFVGWERRCAHPMLDTHFFRARIALRVHVGELRGAIPRPASATEARVHSGHRVLPDDRGRVDDGEVVPRLLEVPATLRHHRM